MKKHVEGLCFPDWIAFNPCHYTEEACVQDHASNLDSTLSCLNQSGMKWMSS